MLSNSRERILAQSDSVIDNKPYLDHWSDQEKKIRGVVPFDV